MKNLDQVEEDDGSELMMASVAEVRDGALTSTHASVDTATHEPLQLTGGHIFLNEQRVMITPSHGTVEPVPRGSSTQAL